MKKCLLLSALLLVCKVLSAQNYDESKVPAYTLPELLRSDKNQKITTAEAWEKVRRPEILRLFEEHVYGNMPKKYDRVSFNIKRENPGAMNGRAHLKEVEILVTNQNETVSINLILFTPNHIKNAAPAFLLINNRSRRNTSATRDTISGFWPAEQGIEAGYAMAAFHYSDAAPDHQDTYQKGALRLYPEQLSSEKGMKAVGAWAWAASRVMDYLESDKAVDALKVAVVGHSRGGKASLWAAAQDQRFAMCVTNCSGNTGAALSHRRYGETIRRINTTFPHWFNDNYKKYNDNEQALPLDQHMLIALIAPRPVYVTNATEDLWADPQGTFLAEKEAEKVYALYHLKSGLPAALPAPDTALTMPPLGYHLRTGIHDMTAYDWAQFIRSANQHFGKR